MRVSRAIWRVAGPTAGVLAPSVVRAYYRGVVASLVRALLRTPGVVAVYAHGSYATGSLRLGRSDVDLDVVIEDVDPAQEVEILVAVSRRYRPRQAVLPIDITMLPRSEFGQAAAWIADRRRRIRTDEVIAPLPSWALLGGEELRTTPVRELDARHAYLREDWVTTALEDWPRSPAALASTVGRLALLAEREQLDTDAALRLRAAAGKLERPDGACQALTAALEFVATDRVRHAVPLERRPETADWQLPQPAEEALAAAADLLPPLEMSSATLYVAPLSLQPKLLLEGETAERCEPLVRWAVAGGAREARSAGVVLEIVTRFLAEDSWRNPGFRWVGLAGMSRHLVGEPLAPRVRLPEDEILRQVLDYRAFFAAEQARCALVGLRTKKRTPSVLPELALARDLLAGLPPRLPSTDADSSALDDRAWTRRAIELRRECLALL